MREYVSREKKTTTTGFSIPSLKHPIPGFGLKSSAISRQAVPGIQPLHKPVTHDISRIPLRTQAKLSISQPGDIYEQEADSVAQQVMQRMAQPVNSKSIQREEAPEEEEELQMKPLNISTLQREALPEEEEELQMKPLDISTLQREALPEEEEELQMKPLNISTLQREALPEEEEELQMKPLDISTLQREALPEEEEELQMKPLDISTLQREALPEEEEELQMKSLDNSTLQREALPEEEEELQMKSLDNSTLQREALPEEEEEELQMKSLDNSTLQREALPEEEEELQMKSMVQRQSKAGMAAAPDLEASINQARGGGVAIADNIREPMEQAFGADFSGVKVHTDGQSDQLNRSIQARAFTTGQDVFFRQGEYNPGSRGGQELLAHELTHVVQQKGNHMQRMTNENESTDPVEVGSIEDLSTVITEIMTEKGWDGSNYGEEWQCNTISDLLCKKVVGCEAVNSQSHVLVRGGTIPGGDRDGNTRGLRYWFFEEYHAYVRVGELGLYDPTFNRRIEEGDVITGVKEDGKTATEIEFEYFRFGEMCGTYTEENDLFMYKSLEDLSQAVEDPTTAVGKYWNDDSESESEAGSAIA
ncbi:MAG: DUF4157 domain-containing protein [Nostoc sp.]|uniref:eCIS core domain-containing protein n=1 Tax=Nostoc sp. TaxID=1180 RepID=UPI002FF8208C